MREPAAAVPATVWRQSGAIDGIRTIPEETAIALTYDGGSYAVMMSTPRDLEDFALGFSFTEGVISSPADIKQLEIVEHDSGTELRMWLTDPRAAALGKRRRYLAGPTGCGLCGIDSLTEAVRPICACWRRRGIHASRDYARAVRAAAAPGIEPANTRRACRGVLAP